MANINSLKASDGTGNAAVATVQSVRAPLATTIVVDTVENINSVFHGTMGTPHTFVDPVTSETITVISEATAVDFQGHVDGGNLEIDTIAPGYTDNGSQVNDIVIIKPTSQWADELVEWGVVEHNQDGTHSDVTATSVTAATINATTDLQQNSVSLNTIRSEIISDFIASGGVVAQSAGLVGTFSNIVYYISGVRYTATSVANKTYTASKDTYVDINSSGTPTYTGVANGAASPALTSGYIRVAKVVTNGSAITSVSQYGKENATQVYPTDRTPSQFYQELARTTLTTTGTTITVSGITPKKYLRVLIFTPISSGTISHTMYFNNDTGNNYSRRRAENGAADNTANNNNLIMASAAAVARWFTTADIINYASEEKMVHGFTSHNGGNGAANYPTRIEFSGKWANTTNAITRIDVANGGAGNFGAGSEVVVLGHD